MIKQRFELTEEEIRLIALYRKREFTETAQRDERILNIKQSMEFIDKFRVLIEAEREMKINSELNIGISTEFSVYLKIDVITLG